MWLSQRKVNKIYKGLPQFKRTIILGLGSGAEGGASMDGSFVWLQKDLFTAMANEEVSWSIVRQDRDMIEKTFMNDRVEMRLFYPEPGKDGRLKFNIHNITTAKSKTIATMFPIFLSF